MRSNADCTIFFKSVDAQTRSEDWTRLQVRCIYWENRKAANVLRSGNLEADQAAIYIPLERGSLAIKTGDVIVRGLVSDEIGDGFTITDLKKKYADVLTVRSVDRMDAGSLAMRHYQIGAS